MATIVFFHAHPDDEAIGTGGTMAKMAAAGHRVVLVTATRGEEGEVDDGFLAEGETLGERREAEVIESASILGVARREFLGYRDSGMMGEPTNDDPACFWQAEVEVAAARLAVILREEKPDVLTVYDEHGAYGHPDHIQVHRVGHRAAEMVGTARIYEATINRDRARLLSDAARADEDDPDPVEGGDPLEGIGLPDDQISTSIDVRDQLHLKRKAMLAHASQIAADSWFMSMPDEVFVEVWGDEWFRRVRPPFAGNVPADRETALL